MCESGTGYQLHVIGVYFAWCFVGLIGYSRFPPGSGSGKFASYKGVCKMEGVGGQGTVCLSGYCSSPLDESMWSMMQIITADMDSTSSLGQSKLLQGKLKAAAVAARRQVLKSILTTLWNSNLTAGKIIDHSL